MNTIVPNDLLDTSQQYLDQADSQNLPINRVHLATAAATLALAKEQHIANLIELAKLAGSREIGALGTAAFLELNNTLLTKAE